MRQGDAMGTVARCCSFIWLKPTAPRIVQAGEDERFEDERFEEGESWTYSSVGEYPHRTEQDEAVARLPQQKARVSVVCLNDLCNSHSLFWTLTYVSPKMSASPPTDRKHDLRRSAARQQRLEYTWLEAQ